MPGKSHHHHQQQLLQHEALLQHLFHRVVMILGVWGSSAAWLSHACLHPSNPGSPSQMLICTTTTPAIFAPHRHETISSSWHNQLGDVRPKHGSTHDMALGHTVICQCIMPSTSDWVHWSIGMMLVHRRQQSWTKSLALPR